MNINDIPVGMYVGRGWGSEENPNDGGQGNVRYGICQWCMLVPMYKDKGERTKCKNYRDMGLLKEFEKYIKGYQYTEFISQLEGLIDYVHGGFKSGKGFVD